MAVPMSSNVKKNFLLSLFFFIHCWRLVSNWQATKSPSGLSSSGNWQRSAIGKKANSRAFHWKSDFLDIIYTSAFCRYRTEKSHRIVYRVPKSRAIILIDHKQSVEKLSKFKLGIVELKWLSYIIKITKSQYKYLNTRTAHYFTTHVN